MDSGICPRRSDRPRCDELASRGDDGDARPAGDGDGVDVRGGDRRELQRSELDSRGDEFRSGGEVLAAPADVRARTPRCLQHAHVTERILEPARSGLERHHGVGARGHAAPVMMRAASPGPSAGSCGVPAGKVGDDPEHDGGCRARRRHVGEAHREPVHRGVVEQRHVHCGAHGGAEGASERLGERDGGLLDRPHGGQDLRQVFVDADHVHPATTRAGSSMSPAYPPASAGDGAETPRNTPSAVRAHVVAGRTPPARA